VRRFIGNLTHLWIMAIDASFRQILLNKEVSKFKELIIEATF
jgi:hypothetical protein